MENKEESKEVKFEVKKKCMACGGVVKEEYNHNPTLNYWDRSVIASAKEYSPLTTPKPGWQKTHTCPDGFQGKLEMVGVREVQDGPYELVMIGKDAKAEQKNNRTEREKIEAYIKECGYTWTYEDILKQKENYFNGIYLPHTAKEIVEKFFGKREEEEA